MQKKSLAIAEKLGSREGMASAYGNLGLIYQTRGELDRAEEMQKKSLAINKMLGRQEGMGSDYRNLGAIYQARGDLDRAAEMLKKSLALFKAIGAAPSVKQVQTSLDTLNKLRTEQ
jgi:tetratricopeptide (TPR) repeat protein